MGLAPYGAPKTEAEASIARALDQFMRDFVQLEKHGRFRVNGDFVYFGRCASGFRRVSETMLNKLQALVPPCGSDRRKPDPKIQDDRPKVMLAWALQKRIEEVFVHIVSYYLDCHRETRQCQAVALAGGVTLNINATSGLINAGLVLPESLFIQPAAGDAGAALGAALLVAREKYHLDPRCRMRRVDLGPVYHSSDYRAALTAAGLKEGEDYEQLSADDAIAGRVADLIAQGLAVAWFQGGSEFGPRALGFRSILLNVLDPTSNARANSVKLRSHWRPSAISIAAESAHSYLDSLHPHAEVPFMNLVFRLRMTTLGSLIQSGCHRADRTSRVQTVAPDQNPLFWAMLKKLEERTGVPAVVNTSFNRNEPLVETPEEALNSYAYMLGVDALILGPYLIRSRANLKPTVHSLYEDPLVRSLLEMTAENDGIDWSSVLQAHGERERSGHRILVSLADAREVTLTESDWPLVKEFFDARTGESLRRFLGRQIASVVISNGAARALIGSTSSKYESTVFNLLLPVVRAALTHHVSSHVVELKRLRSTPSGNQA
jgi:predicted NodU family carbamoyl transferase